MNKSPKPPKTYTDFIRQFPKLGKAWELMAQEAEAGNIDKKTARLIKLGIAIGA